MSKLLLKSWKILSFGVMTVALGLFLASCADTGDDEGDTTYSVTVAFEDVDTDVLLTGITSSGAGSYKAGDTVRLSVENKSGYVFEAWTSDENSSVFGTGANNFDLNRTTTFIMPAKNVRITGRFKATEVETEYYSVNIVGGSAEYDEYEEGEIVSITATPPNDSIFFKWTANTSGVVFDSETDAATTFVMPAEDVTVEATFVAKPNPAAVRFTWELSAQSKIQSIAASFSDVDSWYTSVYMSEDYVEEDASDIPMHYGSTQLPNNIYSKTMHASSGSPHKSKYFSISEGDDDGQYTAVCTIDDPAFDNIADIVANYDVSVTGNNVFFEVGFDVDTFLAGEDDLGWINQIRDNPYSDPRLEKTKAKKLVKKVQKDNVTYYVLHRSRK
ncbi:MAG: hypothetical protein LBB74_07995 [Chitinispirillales bacterium]|jgi:hypothetical protein|nr:hypothetical protein [Chitinispirillales bacterium]